MRFQYKHSAFLFFLFLLCTSNSLLFGQQKKGDQYFERQEYAKSIPYYEKAYKKSADVLIAKKLAESYWRIKQYESAETYYRVLAKNSALDTTTTKQFAEVLKNNNKYDLAKKQVIAVYRTDQKQLFDLGIDQLSRWDNEKKLFDVNSLMGINSQGSDFSPVPYNGSLVFVSDRSRDLVNEVLDGRTLTPYLSLVKMDTIGDSLHFREGEKIASAFQSEYHIGPISFDSALTIAVFNEVKNAKKGKNYVNKPQLYYSLNQHGKWQKPIPFPYNNKGHSLAHPSISKDGKMLVFVRDTSLGSENGKDLYESRYVNGSWSKPSKMGGGVNSSKNELFPYLYDETTLYFASDGHNGYGGLDLFVSVKSKGEWQSPRNLKRPINSERDDFGMAFFGNRWGYFSSNRKSGTGSDDIYHFYLKKDLGKDIHISGVFLYSELDPAKNEKLLLLDANDVLLDITYTDEKGKFSFKHLDELSDYAIQLDTGALKVVTAQSKIIINPNALSDEKQIIRPNKKGKFIFQTLPRDQSATLTQFTIEDEALVIPRIYGKVYELLPGDVPGGLEVVVLDENGEILMTAFTNEKGEFQFEELPLDKTYTIRLKNGQLNETIYLLDEFGEQIASIKKDPESNNYEYQLLAKDQYALEVLANSDIVLNMATNISGLLDLQTLDPDEVFLELLSESNHILDTIYLEKDGSFKSKPLPLYENYQLRMVAKDSSSNEIIAQLFLRNSKGEFVQSLIKQGNVFRFKTLTREEYASLPEMNLEEANLIMGKVYRLLPGDIPQGVYVYLLDEDGLVIDSAMLDAFGTYQFSTLPKDQAYSISIPSFENDDLQLMVFDDDRNLHKVKRNTAGYFDYKRIKSQETRFRDLELYESANVTLEYDGESDNELSFVLLDDLGAEIGRYTHNDFKQFKLLGVDPYKPYFIRVEGLQDADEEKGALYCLNAKRERVLPLYKEREDLFRFYSLNAFEYDILPILDPTEYALHGEVHQRLSEGIPLDLKMYLLDKKREVLDTAVVTSAGHFKFKTLPAETSYLIKIKTKATDLRITLLDSNLNFDVIEVADSSVLVSVVSPPVMNGKDGYKGKVLQRLNKEMPEGLYVYAINEQGLVIDSVMLNTDGTFEFKNLARDHGFKLKVKGIEDHELTFIDYDTYNQPYKGKVLHTLNKDIPGGLYVYAINEHGLVIDSVMLNVDGTFEFKNLARDHGYKLKVKGIEDHELTFIDYDKDSALMANNSNVGEPEAYNDSIALKIIRPEKEIVLVYDTLFLGRLYHPYDRSEIIPASSKEFKDIVAYVKTNKEAKIYMKSFTDAKGSVAYNKKLSQRRAVFVKNKLVENGILAKDVSYGWFSELSPYSTNFMPDGSDNAYGRKHNRRTELFMIKVYQE